LDVFLCRQNHCSNSGVTFSSTTSIQICRMSSIGSAALKKLEASGASIPGSPRPAPVFSPDGLLVYAIEGSEILVYVFNPHTGLLTARTSISAPGVGAVLPVQ
jgi:hypothetical protein